MSNAISVELIAARILEIRGKKVMLDKDLAMLYGVPVKVLNQSVKRNVKRFPEDFMFQLSWEEIEPLRSQIVTLKSIENNDSRRGKHIKYLPYVFTEQGVAMLSSVLNSDRAIQVNIQIIRTFIKLRQLLATHQDLLKKMEALEKRYDRQFRIVFDIMRELTAKPSQIKKQIGFKP